MVPTADINTVEMEDDYLHVQFRDPDQFDAIRTPDWAANVAHSVSDGAEIRTGSRWIHQFNPLSIAVLFDEGGFPTTAGLIKSR